MLRCSTTSLFNFHPKGGQKEKARKIDLHTLWDAYRCEQLGEKEDSNTLEMVGFCPGRATVVAFYTRGT